MNKCDLNNRAARREANRLAGLAIRRVIALVEVRTDLDDRSKVNLLENLFEMAERHEHYGKPPLPRS